jgi:hypothetical protein
VREAHTSRGSNGGAPVDAGLGTTTTDSCLSDGLSSSVHVKREGVGAEEGAEAYCRESYARRRLGVRQLRPEGGVVGRIGPAALLSKKLTISSPTAVPLKWERRGTLIRQSLLKAPSLGATGVARRLTKAVAERRTAAVRRSRQL